MEIADMRRGRIGADADDTRARTTAREVTC